MAILDEFIKIDFGPEPTLEGVLASQEGRKIQIDPLTGMVTDDEVNRLNQLVYRFGVEVVQTSGPWEPVEFRVVPLKGRG